MNQNRLKDLREYNDLLQKDIAEILNISQQAYSLFEKGIKIIPLKKLNILCNYYNVSIDYILFLSNNKNDNDIIKIKDLDKKLIGMRIKELRKTNNLTLKNLADELNTTTSTISAYETGKTLILTAFAYQLCKKYKISLDWLCGRK